MRVSLTPHQNLQNLLHHKGLGESHGQKEATFQDKLFAVFKRVFSPEKCPQYFEATIDEATKPKWIGTLSSFKSIRVGAEKSRLSIHRDAFIVSLKDIHPSESSERSAFFRVLEKVLRVVVFWIKPPLEKFFPGPNLSLPSTLLHGGSLDVPILYWIDEVPVTLFVKGSESLQKMHQSLHDSFFKNENPPFHEENALDKGVWEQIRWRAEPALEENGLEQTDFVDEAFFPQEASENTSELHPKLQDQVNPRRVKAPGLNELQLTLPSDIAADTLQVVFKGKHLLELLDSKGELLYRTKIEDGFFKTTYKVESRRGIPTVLVDIDS